VVVDELRDGFRRPRRDEERRHAEPVDVEVRVVIRWAGDSDRRLPVAWREHVIEEAAGLVVADDQQRLRPCGPLRERVVELRHEPLPARHVAGRMVVARRIFVVRDVVEVRVGPREAGRSPVSACSKRSVMERIWAVYVASCASFSKMSANGRSLKKISQSSGWNACSTSKI
jgi:hypothetical protein